jgi:hypothetical protein
MLLVLLSLHQDTAFCPAASTPMPRPNTPAHTQEQQLLSTGHIHGAECIRLWVQTPRGGPLLGGPVTAHAPVKHSCVVHMSPSPAHKSAVDTMVHSSCLCAALLLGHRWGCRGSRSQQESLYLWIHMNRQTPGSLAAPPARADPRAAADDCEHLVLLRVYLLRGSRPDHSPCSHVRGCA